VVTCGGTFDQATGHYLSNVIVFAVAVSWHHGQQAAAGLTGPRRTRGRQSPGIVAPVGRHLAA
jgi:hypothetical protein